MVFLPSFFPRWLIVGIATRYVIIQQLMICKSAIFSAGVDIFSCDSG